MGVHDLPLRMKMTELMIPGFLSYCIRYSTLSPKTQRPGFVMMDSLSTCEHHCLTWCWNFGHYCCCHWWNLPDDAMRYARAKGSGNNMVVSGRRTCIPVRIPPYDIHLAFDELACQSDQAESQPLSVMEQQNLMLLRRCPTSCLVPHSRKLSRQIGRCFHVLRIEY